jgi:hypothetical protein
MNRKKSWLSVESSGAKPSASSITRSTRSHIDDATDRVAGEPTVKRLDQIDGGEVADAQSGLHGGVDPTNEKM